LDFCSIYLLSCRNRRELFRILVTFLPGTSVRKEKGDREGNIATRFFADYADFAVASDFAPVTYGSI
jgi:hypothetical protein